MRTVKEAMSCPYDAFGCLAAGKVDSSGSGDLRDGSERLPV